MNLTDRSLRNAFIALFISVAVLGCQTIGVPQATTFNERLAAALTAVTAARETSNTLLNAERISSADHANVEAQADNLRAAIDIARTLSSIDTSAAEAKLQSAEQMLIALRTYLRSKQS